MKLRIAPARRGLFWIKSGFRTFGRYPWALVALFWLLMLALGLIGTIPAVGTFIALALLPLSTLCMLVASALAEQGQRPALATVLRALQLDAGQRRTFAQLGICYALAFVLVLGISALFDGGQLARLYLWGGEITYEIAQRPDFMRAAWATMLLYAPLSMLFWFAPALAYWHRVPAAKALFFSAMACWRNLGAFALYAMAWMGVAILCGLALAIGASLLVGLLGSAGRLPLYMLTIGGALFIGTVFMVSMAFSVRDCFESPQTDTLQNDSV